MNKRDNQALSDSALVGLLCSLVTEWGEKLTDPQTRPQPLTNWLKGDSFEAEMRLEPDYDRTDGGLCIAIRLKRLVRGPQREKFIYIRYGAASRRLDHARTWRRLGGLRRKTRIHRRHEGVSLVGLAREIYWHPSTLGVDLRIQLVIALIQLDLLRDSALLSELLDYFKAFRKRIPRDIANEAANEVLRNWSFPEDYRAFRRYVCEQLNLALSRNISQGGDELTEGIRPEEVHHSIRDAESKVGVLSRTDDEDSSNSVDDGDRGNSVGLPPVRLPAGGLWTVPDASFVLGVTPRYVYKLIQSGSLQSVRRHRGVVVPASEIDRLRALFAQKEFNGTRRQELVNQGIKSEAARKRIYRERKGGPPSTEN